jgi:hypothetical protein
MLAPNPIVTEVKEKECDPGLHIFKYGPYEQGLPFASQT